MAKKKQRPKHNDIFVLPTLKEFRKNKHWVLAQPFLEETSFDRFFYLESKAYIKKDFIKRFGGTFFTIINKSTIISYSSTGNIIINDFPVKEIYDSFPNCRCL